MLTDYADRIKESVTMTDICRQYGIYVNHAGFACCPFHGERTASMKIYPGRKGWHCFGCNQGGDIISFVCKYFGLSFPNAVRKINLDFGLHLPIDEKPDKAEERQARQMAYKRRQAEQQRKKRHQALQIAYDEALRRFVALDAMSSLMRSGGAQAVMDGAQDPLTDIQTEAIKSIDEAWYELCEAQARLTEFERTELRGLSGINTA